MNYNPNQTEMTLSHFNTSYGTFSETSWSNMNVPKQISGTCASHTFNDVLESRYRIAFGRAGCWNRCFLKKIPIEDVPNYFGGGGLVDSVRYCGNYSGQLDVTGIRGEGTWEERAFLIGDNTEEIVPALRDPGMRYPIRNLHKLYFRRCVGKNDDLIGMVADELRKRGPIYGQFWCYPGYGSPFDEYDHKNGQPHDSILPTDEDLIKWQENKCEPIHHAVMLTGYGTVRPFRHPEEPLHYFQYRNSWGNHVGTNGYMRVLVDYLALVSIPEIRPVQSINVTPAIHPIHQA